MGLCSGLKPILRVSRPSTDSVRTTSIEPHKTESLAADGVESISERPCRYQVVGCCGGGAVERASMRYLQWEPE